MRKETLQRAKEIIRDYCYPDYVNDDLTEFCFEIYCDYRDELSDESIIEMCKAKDPYEAFSEKLFEWATNYEMQYGLDELEKTILEHFTQEEKDDWDWDEFAQEVALSWYYPEEHFNQDINVNIYLDTGNGNCDFTCDNVLNWYGEHGYGDGKTFDKNSSILWLAKQQRKVTLLRKEVLAEATDDEHYTEKGFMREPISEDRFCKSIIQELENLPSHMGTLTFLVSMSLFDLFKLKERINEEAGLNNSYTYENRKGTGYFILDKSTMCGLADPWNGGGSVLEIELDKDVKIPYKAIHSCEPDGYYRYDIDSVYGLVGSAWKDTLKKIA